jgi:hypothetical protein
MIGNVPIRTKPYIPKKCWYVVVDRSGHHRPVIEGHLLTSSEYVVGSLYTYLEACCEANKLNDVSEMLEA